MGLLQDIVYKVKNGKPTITEPVVKKDVPKENEKLKKLSYIKSVMKESDVSGIDKEIYAIKYGFNGERKVAFELKNSLVPSLILHDIRLVDADTDNVAQFDFLVICSTCIFVLEVKNLSGEIQVNENDEFFRIIFDEDGKYVRKEGMYSPIEQNERHIRLLQMFLKKNKFNLDVPMKSAIIMANSRLVLKKKNASEEVQSKLYKVDQVAKLLKKEVQCVTSKKLLDSEMEKISALLIQNNKPLTVDYEEKYSKYIKEARKEEERKEEARKEEARREEVRREEARREEVRREEARREEARKEEARREEVRREEERREEERKKETRQDMNGTKSDDELRKKLKSFRMRESKQRNIKPFMVFNDNQMTALITEKPLTKEALLQVSGFGKIKVEWYGEELISIIKNA